MKKLKTKNKILLSILSVIVLIIVILINWDNITLPKYEFTDSGYSIGSKIDINGVIYEEISEEEFNEIERKLNIDSSKFSLIGRIDYVQVDDIWKYHIYGNKSVEDRILLKGHTYENWVNYPELYFCRKAPALFTKNHVEGVNIHPYNAELSRFIHQKASKIEHGNDIADELVFYINRAGADVYVRVDKFKYESKYYHINEDDVLVANVEFKMNFKNEFPVETTITVNRSGYYINVIEYFAGVPLMDNGSAEIPYDLVQRIFGKEMPMAEEYMEISRQ